MRPGTRTLGATLLLTLLLASPVQAQVTAASESAPLDWYNRKVHAFNEWAIERFGSPSTWTKEGLVPAFLGQAFANALANLVNEPVTAIAGLVAGDEDRTANATRRFALNSTLGVAGIRDVAAERGRPADYLDLGLALCARGVPDGPVVMLPFVGPRTLRDGFADSFVTSVLFFYVPYVLLGDVSAFVAWGTISLGGVTARTVTLRQMDPETFDLPAGNYDALRADYLAQRQARCQRYRSMVAHQH